MDRPATGIAMERPKTRWSREQADNLQSSGRSSSKMERPQSRRGIKSEIQVDSRDALSRPFSTSLFTGNRSSAMGSRLNGSMSRLSTAAYPTSQRVFERPITQQGISGMRPGSTRGPRLTRLVQDKRYYEGLVQLKIRELSQEIESITRQLEQQNKEKATFLHFDRRAKDLAGELTDLQGQLADYNTVLDKMTSNTEKPVIEQTANELASINEGSMGEIEEIFEQRRKAEQRLHKLQKEIEEEKKNAERIVEMMDPGTRKRYDKLHQEREKLKEETDKIQQQVDDLTNEKLKLEEGIALSQVKQEAVKLHVKTMEVEVKRDRLLEENRNKLNPENEKSQLLERVKQDNVDIAAAESRVTEVKKRTLDVEHELEEMEKDLKENYTEKGIRYKEVHKKEQIMEQFLSTFDQDKAEEVEKLKKLEKTVVGRLEEISKRVSGGSYFTSGDDISAFKIQLDDSSESPPNIDDLKKRYTKLQSNFLRMKAMESKFKGETAELGQRVKKRQVELKGLEELQRSNSKKGSLKDLTAEKDRCKEEEVQSRQDLEVIEKEYNEAKGILLKNETYAQISSLEDKLETLKQQNETSENYINNQKSRLNYSVLRSQAGNLINQYNKILTVNVNK